MNDDKKDEKIFTVLVAEPWDFVSSDGKNILKVRYVTHEKDYFIFESVSNYEGYTRYLMFKNRSSSFSGVYGVAQIGESIEHIDESSLQLDFIVSMKEDEVYTITVFAIPEGGRESDGKSAAMQIQLYTGQTPQPTPEPIAEIGPVQITVSGQVAENGGVYYADRDALTVAWSVEGEVTGYNVAVTDSTGATVLEKND